MVQMIEAGKVSSLFLSLFFLLLVQEKQSLRFSFQGNRGFNLLKNLRLQSYRNLEDQRFEAKKVVEVAIVGGGPAGLLSALTLLNRNEFFPDSSVEYRVRILESNEDPRNTTLGPRSYPLGLGLRGQYVLQSFEQSGRPRWRGLWEKVQQIGIESDRLFVHINRWKLPIRQPADPSVSLSQPLIAANTTKSLLIQRNRLCSVLLDFLLEHFPTTGSQRTPNQEHKLQCGPLTIDFQTKISAIDFSMRSLQLSTGECVKYDLLLGCDGVNSIVRRSLQTYSTSLPSLYSFKTEEILLPWQFKVMSQPIPPTLESDAIHAFPDMSRFFSKPQQHDQSSQGFSLFAIPTVNQQLATVINWKRDDTPNFLDHSNLSDVTPELQREVAEIFERQYPSFGKPSLEAVGQLVRQRASNIRKVRCNCYHNTQARVALVGDAVHATDATWGQGLSATFLDIAALDQCLTECRDDLTLALPRYSERQVKEGLALWQLIALPPKGLIGLFYSASEIFIGLCRRLPVVGRLFPLPIQYLISKTIMPYSEIVKLNEYWTNIATEGQEKYEYMAKE